MRGNIRVLLLIFFIFCIALGGCKKESVWKPGTPLPKENIKIAVIYFHEIKRNSFYDNAHYEGTLEMQRNIGLEDSQIIHKANVSEDNPGEAEGIMRDYIAEGANIIIATTFGYINVCEKLAAKFPSVIFVQAMGNRHNKHNFTSYTTRLYHARYLSGIAAGLKTKTGKIGYVAAMGKDNSEVTGGINAFAIGVETVNPEARIYVHVTYNWYDPMGETDAATSLITAGCDVIAAHSNTSMVQMAAQKAGVWTIGFNNDMSADAPDAVLTSVIPHWGVIYTKLVESVINGTFRSAIYFYGLEEGAVGITPPNEKLVTPRMIAEIEAARQRILKNGFNVFDGVLKTNDGGAVGEAGKTLSDGVILNNINWYYQNIIIVSNKP